MPRIARWIHPGGVYHVISRFVDRDWLFRTMEERMTYLRFLGRALRDSDWRCLAYCLMSNHAHFAFVAGSDPLHTWARRVNSPFAHWLNARHGRLGPIFADRPAAYHLPAARGPELLAYIHNNPVRAGVVAAAGDSPWSSHRAYVGKARRPAWLSVKDGLALAGCARAPQQFERLVVSRHGRVEPADLAAIRAEVRSSGPLEVGTPSLSRPTEVPIVARACAVIQPSIAALVAQVQERYAIRRTALGRRYSRGVTGAARRVMIHAAAELGIPLSDAAAAVGVSRQRGSAVFAVRLSAEEQRSVDAVVGRCAKG